MQDFEIPGSLTTSLEFSSSMLVECYETALEFLAARYPLLMPNLYERVFSRMSFEAFIQIFQKIYREICDKIRKELAYFDESLDRLKVGVSVAENMTADMSGIKKQIDNAWSDFNISKARAEQLRDDLIDAERRCREAEVKVSEKQKNEDEAKLKLNEKMAHISPQYDAAIASLNNLNKADIEEFRTYRDPSNYIVNIVNSLCVLFNRQETWECGKLLMININFCEMLIFYPKDDIPDEMYTKLGKYVSQPDFTPPEAEVRSKAAHSICAWVISIYKYATVVRQLQPLVAKVKKAAKDSEDAQRFLGKCRVAANLVRANLRAELDKAKQLKRLAIYLEQQIKVRLFLINTPEIVCLTLKLFKYCFFS